MNSVQYNSDNILFSIIKTIFVLSFEHIIHKLLNLTDLKKKKVFSLELGASKNRLHPASYYVLT